ncbi:NAD(+)/NADH kinase [Blautia sp. 2744]|uniref:NAD kinase n=3 Tax=Blautia TaxID=572511 RepID=D4LX86_9FIRM|nr:MULTISPECIES: NAD(+)/NADH kinase [Blautia]MBC5740971.1 NAD(+)/NADH kinase [Blautia intestinalis]RHA46987.1 NAD(+)/NADH kinase [Blautia obeum]RHD34227.1 NAD(+)/NADH kinase [Blautia obeum]RHE40566.1 NAD(+)/NADH kinase [Blautia obeum]CBL22239.1 Predicted sugar kinase [Blautia obeum A2-162]
MDKFYIITNRDKDQNLRFTEEIVQYLKEHGKKCQVQQAERRVEGEYHYTDPALIPEDTQCILVLGGDGTLLQAARDVVHREIPMLGINLGTLGFLAEIDKTSIYTALDKLFEDDYEIEERMMLTGTVWRGDKITGQDVALNDIVISRVGPPLRVIGFNNYVNDGYLNSYNADGIIIATPTGSTGYSLSCGGPIISPNAAMTVMTPIAPHTLNTRSIIFPEDDVITVELGEGRRQIQENGLASFDGDVEVPMSTGDRIVIKKASVSVKILKLNHLSFVEVLRQKMSNN